MTIAEIHSNAQGHGAPGERRLFGAVTLSLGVLAAGAARAVPVQVPGSDIYSYTIEKSDVTGHSGGTVDVLGQDGAWQGGRYVGGGGLYANAWASYYFLGAAAVAVGTLIWSFQFQAPDRPLDLYLDWDVSIITGSSAILGAAGGGGQLKLLAEQLYPGFPIPHIVGFIDEVYQDSATDGGVTYLGHVDPGEEWWMGINFLAGSTASTVSVVGIAAEADTFGFLSFSFWADDGTSPPAPVPEPAAPWLLAGALPLLGLAAWRRPGRRSGRQGA